MKTALMLAVLTFSTTVAAAADEKKDGAALSKEEQAILDLVNAERKKADLPPLAVNAKLCVAARCHCVNMAKQNKLDHELDGKTLTDRAGAVEYTFRRLGENIAMGQRTPAEAMESWMNSAGHKANILKPEYTEIGIGIATSESGDRYWTQVFGTASN